MENKIEIIGNRAKLIGNYLPYVIGELDLELSYKPFGYEYSKAYKDMRWDGRIRLLKSNLEFRVGFLDRVKKFFLSKNIDIPIIDHNKTTSNNPINIYPRLKEIKKELRQHQIDASNAALEKKCGIIRAATGAGKTLMLADIVARIGKKTIVMVIGKDLLYQFHSFFESVFQTEIGIVGDGKCSIKDINVVSLWTAAVAFGEKDILTDDEELEKEESLTKEKQAQLRKLLETVDLFIFDEVHLASCQSMQTIAKNISPEYCIGCSATDKRSDNSELLIESIFGSVIIDIPASGLIEKGYLVKPIIKFIKVPRYPFYIKKNYREIYQKYIVENDVRNNLILRAGLSMLKQDFVILILFKTIKHGKIIYDMFKNEGVYCNFLDGSDKIKERHRVVKEVEEGKCKIIMCSTIFDIGVDIPILNGLILAGGGKSFVKTKQRIGRVIRPYTSADKKKKKEFAAVIDFHDRIFYLEEHSLIRKEIYKMEPGFEIEEI